MVPDVLIQTLEGVQGPWITKIPAFFSVQASPTTVKVGFQPLLGQESAGILSETAPTMLECTSRKLM